MSKYFQPIEIDTGCCMWAVTFTPNSKYLVSGGDKDVRMWRVKDGDQVLAMMRMRDVRCVAVSKDGKFIAAGSNWGDVLVWEPDYDYSEVVFAGKISIFATIFDVDFSPNSSRLVSADSDFTATVWDFVARKRVQKLNHNSWVKAAKYSPRGERIATATEEGIRVWDSDSGHLLAEVKAELKPWQAFLWFNSHFLVKSKDSKIKQIDVSTGSTISEWSVSGNHLSSSISLSQHGQFIAYSTTDNITLWDTSTHTQLGCIQQSGERTLCAFSPDGQLFAMVAQQEKIVIKDLSLVIPINIDSAALQAWKQGHLANTEALLTAAISTSKDTAHHVLASRALVRVRLRQWDAALADAQKSLNIRSSVVGHIAKCAALVGKGDTAAGCQVCDTISPRSHSDLVGIHLLIKAVVLFMAGEHDDAISHMSDFSAVHVDPTFYVVLAYMHLHCGNLYMESNDYARAIRSFEDGRAKLGDYTHMPPLIISLISGWNFDDLAITIHQRECETLLLVGQKVEASRSVLRMVDQTINMTESVRMWVSDFVERCLATPGNDDDVDPVTAGDINTSHPMASLLSEWASPKLTTGSWQDTFTTATSFMLPRPTVYQVICERLEITGRAAEAAACFHQMLSESAQEIDNIRASWTRDFESRCRGKLVDLGENSMISQSYDAAILQYTAALSLNPTAPQDLLCRRCMAHVAKGEWDSALSDANEVIRLDPYSLLGHERKCYVLHRKGDHDDAMAVYETMLTVMSESSDPEIRERSHHYLWPEEKKAKFRTLVEDMIRDSPPVLIDTVHGCLCDKSERASAFEQTPTFKELISSVTTHVDDVYTVEEVEKYFRYATFSHKWEDNEPLFEKVLRVVVYDLEASPAHEKLQMFCKIVREAGFNWAWSDTCCINKGDHFVLQEALVSMFKWYERSAMTIIFLRGVDRLAKRGALTRSIWNMRAWTLQEYHASKVVQIYTEDWTPYLGLEIYNHKESPEIVSEMEEATGISAQALMALHPGLDDIREKLRLASTRHTARVEDAAYSLLGIFSLSLPITYGEGDQALGRLLAQLLTSSGDISILAWTGRSNTFNSCLPASITVFSEPLTSHIPPAIPDAEMGKLVAGFRSLNLTIATTLYDRLNGLSVAFFIGRRMKLPCLTFKLGPVSVSQNGAFRAQTNALGIVEIQTQEDLSRLGSLSLVHPWIDFLLDRQPVGSVLETITEENTDPESSLNDLLGLSNIPSTRQTRMTRLMTRIGLPLGGRSALEVASLLPPSTLTPVEKRKRVLQFIARVGQPFGALLLTPTRRNIDEYRRVATESLIKVQVEEITPVILDRLIHSVRILDVL